MDIIRSPPYSLNSTMSGLFRSRTKGAEKSKPSVEAEKNLFGSDNSFTRFNMRSDHIEFEINGVPAHQVLTISDLKEHLKLLNAFYHLREVIKKAPSIACDETYHEDTRFSAFLSMAVERFLVMIEKGRVETYEVVPLDVMMVWHAYCLNPRIYQNDSMLDKDHTLPDCFPLSQYAKHLIRMDDHYVIKATPEQAEVWERITDTKFDPVEHYGTCQWRIVYNFFERKNVRVPWLTPSGMGYAQQDFKYTTGASPATVLGSALNGDELCLTHETLGLYRFYSDMRKYINNQAVGIGATAYLPIDTADPEVALDRNVRVQAGIVRLHDHMLDNVEDIQEYTDAEAIDRLLEKALTKDRLIMKFRMYTRFRKRLILSIMGSYENGERASIDLRAAVLRQFKFVEKMVNMGWSAPNAFSESPVALFKSIVRYHAFLDVFSSQVENKRVKKMVVPTLDIDLAWHTHQLTGEAYVADCERYLTILLDHDDKVPELQLSDSFERTCQLWKSRFGVNYTDCGCVDHHGGILGDKQWLVLPLLSSSRPQTSFYAAEVSPRHEDPDNGVHHGPSHPSAHNRLVLLKDSTTEFYRRSARHKLARQKKYARYIKRQERDARKGIITKAEYQRKKVHYPVFLEALTHYTYYGSQGYPTAHAGCAMIDAEVRVAPDSHLRSTGACAVYATCSYGMYYSPVCIGGVCGGGVRAGGCTAACSGFMSGCSWGGGSGGCGGGGSGGCGSGGCGGGGGGGGGGCGGGGGGCGGGGS